MNTPFQLKIDPEKVHEIPMVDLAFEILRASGEPFYYRDLMNEVAKLRGLSEEEINQVIAQLYTEINIDGRFACVGSNLWGLKRWYPVERSEDALGNAKHPRIINDDDDLDDEEYVEEEEEYVPDEDDFDSLDEDREDLYEDEDDEADVDDEVLLDDEEIDETDAEEEEIEDDFEDPDDNDK